MSGPYDDIMDRGMRKKNVYAAFIRSLKKQHKSRLDELFSHAGEEAFRRIDCRECGRCCTGLGPRLTDRDIDRLAAGERMTAKEFIDSYLRMDEDGDMVLRNMPCPFFGVDGLCLVYQNRPAACRDYPHMDGGRQNKRLTVHIENLSHCPAVILAVESLMSGNYGYSAGT